MSDTVSALMGKTMPKDPRIKQKGNVYVIDGKQGEYPSYEDAYTALVGVDPLHGQGPTMTTGESAMDWADEQSQPGAKAPNSTQTPNDKNAPPAKPDWVTKSEKSAGVIYEWDAAKKKWRPKKGA
jgi:hypothetical protein